MSRRQIAESMDAHELCVQWPAFFASRNRMEIKRQQDEEQRRRRV